MSYEGFFNSSVIHIFLVASVSIFVFVALNPLFRPKYLENVAANVFF